MIEAGIQCEACERGRRTLGTQCPECGCKLKPTGEQYTTLAPINVYRCESCHAIVHIMEKVVA